MPFVVPAVRFARISLVQTIVLLASLFAVAAVPASQAADTPKPPPGPNSDPTVHHQLGMDWGDRGYWKVMTPHEVAHPWWGHAVSFSSYCDQWMCEGFADMSASLCLSVIEKNPKKFITFWNNERELSSERNPQGFRAIDAGSLTMGYRTSNSRTGFDTTGRLIYPQGAYILHMIRMMMHDNRSGDQRFKETMQDFVKTYAGKAATTEDFKAAGAAVEKPMTVEMDLRETTE